MPKMTHPYDPTHQVDVADEKVAVYLAQGWSTKRNTEPANPAVTRAALSEGAPVKKAAAKKAAQKPAA